MRITKLLSLIVSCVLIIGSALSITSCEDSEIPQCTEHTDNNGDGICDSEGCGAAVAPIPEEKPGVFNENGELYLFKDGVPTFRFVMAKDTIRSFSIKIKDLAETLSLYTKDNLMPEIANYTAEPTDVEILIGTFDSRGDEYFVNKYEYGSTGYLVKQIGTKIVVTGGSDAAIENAVKHLKEVVFGIKKTNDPFGYFVMTEDKSCVLKQSNYFTNDVTVNSVSVKDCVITFPKTDTVAKSNAESLQALIYEKTGIHMETMIDTVADGQRQIAIRTLPNDGVSGGFYIRVDESSNLIIEYQFPQKSEQLIKGFFKENVFTTQGTFNFPADYSYAPNLRHVSYSDYGAVGDGVTDDFFAIKAAHDDANVNQLIVHADPDATYYIGNANGSYTINIRTNTYFHGCKFIFDDECVDYTSSGRQTPIFGIRSNYGKSTYNKNTTPVKSLEKGASNIGWAPGVPS